MKTPQFAKVKTKSNFKGLNNQWLKVIEIVGNRVTCEVLEVTAYNGKLSVDFTLNEVIEFKS
jgi:hypothetical protein